MPEVVTLEGCTDRTVQEWDDLATVAGCAPFLRPGWLEAVRRQLVRGADVQLLTARRHGRLVGLLPVVASRSGLSTLGSHQAHLSGAVTLDATALRALVVELLRLSPRRARLRFVDGGADLSQCVLDAAHDAGRPVLRRVLLRSPWSDVSGDWAQYQERFSAGSLKQHRKQWRGLARLGSPTCGTEDGDGDLDGLLDETLKLEAAGWKGQARSALLARPVECRFFLDAARWAAGEGMLRVSCLRLDGRLIAYQVSIEQHATLYHVKTSYDGEFASYSPGALLALRIVEDACASPHLRTIELLGDADAWKLRVADGVREVVELTAFRAGLVGVAERAALARAAHGRAQAKQLVPEAQWQRLSWARAVVTGRT